VDFIEKPIDSHAMFDAVKRALERDEALRSARGGTA
jgi:FixJ family two-component response regulator